MTQSIIETHYEILGVKESATQSEIKTAHRKKALQYHPDRQDSWSSSQARQRQHSEQEQDEQQTGNAFRQIQLAWECLRDEEKRLEYDDSLRRIRERDNVTLNKAKTVKLSEMEWEDCLVEDDHDDGEGEKSEAVDDGSQKLYSYACRCSDVFEILEEELLEEPRIWACQSCSLTINVIIDC